MDLTGELVRLRSFRPEDADALAEIATYPEVARFAGRPFLLPITPEHFRQHHSGPDSNRISWTVEDRQAGEVIGNTSLNRINHLDRHCWFAIALGPPDRLGHGRGTEATILVTRFAFRQLGMEKVYLAVYEGNERGMRAYRKAGYQVEATLERHHYSEGRLVTTHWMAVYRDHPLYAVE